MIAKTLSHAEALELFHKEAVLFGQDSVTEHRVAVLFGKEIADYIACCIGGNWMKSGVDWNGWGSGEPERPMIHYYYLSGFLKIVAEHNYRLIIKRHMDSSGQEL